MRYESHCLFAVGNTPVWQWTVGLARLRISMEETTAHPGFAVGFLSGVALSSHTLRVHVLLKRNTGARILLASIHDFDKHTVHTIRHRSRHL